MNIDRDALVRLQNQLQRKREGILADARPLTIGGILSSEKIRELADVERAHDAVVAELARRRPRLGYGSVA